MSYVLLREDNHEYNYKKKVTCPENRCITPGNFCIEEELGDGICQFYNNGPFCNYDNGDCCPLIHDTDCCYCKCRDPEFGLLVLGH